MDVTKPHLNNLPKKIHQHPLEFVEKNYRLQQDNLNFEMLKKIQGIHAPLRLMAERRAASQVGRLPFMASSNLMKDVLEGRDGTIDFEDVFNGEGKLNLIQLIIITHSPPLIVHLLDSCRPEVLASPHVVMERKLGLM